MSRQLLGASARGWAASLGLAALLSACGSSRSAGFQGGPGDASAEDAGATDEPGAAEDDASPGPSAADGGPLTDAAAKADAALLAITPAAATLTVSVSATGARGTETFRATLAGAAVGATWGLNRADLGSIDAATGVFTPSGTRGGSVLVTASAQGQQASTTLNVDVVISQAGDPSGTGNATGAGGYGGVGGSGVGLAATPAQVATLGKAPTADAALSLLYPYDQTVWPRGVLPPLLQWSAGAHAFDAVRIHLHEANYDYSGYFQKPAAALAFVNHPIPKTIWDQLAASNGGEDVTVTLTFSENGAAYGPLTETWKISRGALAGTVYYNSYGTSLALNGKDRTIKGARFGGATLAIRPNSISPSLIAGSTTDDATGCRVCHSVNAQGTVLVTQHGDAYGTSSIYDLANGNVETVIPNNNGGRFAVPALSPDGALAFSASESYVGASGPSALYALPGGTQVTASGLSSNVQAFTPTFSPDGSHIVYTDLTTRGLASIDFDGASKAFANPQVVFTPPAGQAAYWPSFFPGSGAAVFELEVQGNGRDTGGTRSQCDDTKNKNHCLDQGVRAELWWVDTRTKTAARLDRANGVGYLPSHPSAYVSPDKDNELNYEPTVYPVAADGYAWVIFTSRRLYGNVATINPYWSDPRYNDISTPDKATTKKLWVAAIDLNAPPGTDPSHPAFYLPAQELLAGNSRGFWVVDVCAATGGCN